MPQTASLWSSILSKSSNPLLSQHQLISRLKLLFHKTLRTVSRESDQGNVRIVRFARTAKAGEVVCVLYSMLVRL